MLFVVKLKRLAFMVDRNSGVETDKRVQIAPRRAVEQIDSMRLWVIF